MDGSKSVKQVKLLRDLDQGECEVRNALSQKIPGYVLHAGQVGEVVDTLEGGTAFLVEFGNSGPDTCDWFGVLYAGEIEQQVSDALAA